MSKEERSKVALKRRQEEVAARKKVLDEAKASQLKYQDVGFSSGHVDRKRWEDREGEREKQREETLHVKDKEREIEAIKVLQVMHGRIVHCFLLFSRDTWEQTKSVGKCAAWLTGSLFLIGILVKTLLLTSTQCV